MWECDSITTGIETLTLFPYKYQLTAFAMALPSSAMENNIIYQKSLAFSKLLMDLIKDIDTPAYKHIFFQLKKSGTAIGASIAEADSAQSMVDFISKMKIADKEANETVYWLSLLENDFPQITQPLLDPVIEIKRILRSILVTCNRKLKQKQSKNPH
jgi:four helix bundle protein